MATDTKDNASLAAWQAFWFLNGGGIHRAYKHRQWSELKALAMILPKAAWDEQQKVIDRLMDELEELRAKRGGG